VEHLSKISLHEKFSSFDDLWQPKIVARVDDYAVKLVKVEGEFVWHHHDNDELFFVVTGGIRMKYRVGDREDEVSFGPGEMLRVPKGVEHLPAALPGTELMLIERGDLVNTGNVESDRTAVPATI